MNINSDQWINLIQTIFKVFGGALAAKGIGDSSVWEAASGAAVALVTFLISHYWNKTPVTATAGKVGTTTSNPPTTGQSGFARFALMLFVGALCVVCVLCFVIGCAEIQPGNDPIVVNAERAQTIAAPAFDLVLGLDDANRPFFQEKAPPFHNFCEWLRASQTAFLADGTPTNVQRSIAMQLNLDKVKLDYKASKASSNDVLEAMITLQSAEQQANAWLTIVTNPVPLNLYP